MAFGLLAFICLVGAALAGPVQRNAESTCATQCPQRSQNEKFNYQPGHKYVYHYKGSNFMKVATQDQQNVVTLECTAELLVRDRCEMTLQLKDVRISQQHDADDDELQQSLEIPMPFAWVDGEVEQICSSSEELPGSENIKKSILSLIVNTMKDLQSPSTHTEVDSLGSCKTKYSIVRQSGSSVSIKKEKSLESCTNSQEGYNSVMTNKYQSSEDSENNGVPIFSDSEYICRQEIRDQLIQQVSCKEKAVVKPLSKEASIIEVAAEVQMTLQGKQQLTNMPQHSISERKSILYSYNQEQDAESKEKEAQQILGELCQLTQGILQPKVSKLYYDLIMVLKGLPSESVQSLYHALKSKQLCQSQKTLDIFLDALPMAGTEGAIQLMVQLIKTKEITGIKADLWPASFALIPNPNAEAVAAILPLVSEEQNRRPVLLGLSAMIHRICSRADCSRIPSVRQALQVLHRGLGKECQSEDSDKVVSILKAFGNMGYLGEAEETVLQCATSQDKHLSVRLAAVDAFRRYRESVPQELIRLYSSKEVHYEVRIAALATIIKNANEEVKRAIQHVLEDSREDIQVVAYTQSLLKNWQKTSSPLKQDVRELLQGIESSRNDIGYWENSKNIELSLFNTPMNLGASAESDIIHASGSKIPRFLSTKLDIDLFGKNINLFELGVRAEGLEQTIQKIMGAESSSSSSKKSWFPLSSSQESEDEKPEASLYLRTMGTEFLDLSVSDVTSVGSMMQVADIFNKLARGEKADVAHSFLFLNTKLVVQSVTGRSYTFGMTGSATAALTADGKFDIINLFNSPSNCHIEGRLQPSANLEFATTVGIHSQKSRPDIKIVTSFHTGADVGAKLKVKDSHVAEARLDMPSDEVHLLKISTELFEIDSNQNEKRIIEHMEKKIDSCLRTLEKPLGIHVCAELETPKPFVSKTFPYAHGLGNLQLSIKKTDPSMQGYVATIEIPKHSSRSVTYRVSFDTPGSSINRKFEANLEMKSVQQGERQFQLDMQSPFKKISSNGNMIMRRNLLQSSCNIILDDQSRYSVKAVMETSISGSKKTFKPTLQWTSPGKEPVSVAGSIVYDEGRKQHLMFDFRSSKPENKPFVLTGNLMKDGHISLSKSAQWKLSADLVAKCPFITAKIHTAHNKRSGQAETISSAFTLDYNRPRSEKHSVKFSSEVHQSSSRTGASALFESTQMPQYNCELTWDMQGRPQTSMKNDVMLKYGQNQQSQYIQISQTYQHGDRHTLTQCSASVKAPHLNIDSDLNVAVDLHPVENSNLHLEADLRYHAQKHLKTSVQMKRVSRSPIKMEVKAALAYPGRKMSYEDEIVETSRNVFEGQSKLQWQENQKATLRYRYKRSSESSSFHHEFEYTLNTPSMRSPLTHKSMLKMSEESMELETQVESQRRMSYSIQAKLRKHGSSTLSVKLPGVEGQAQLDNQQQKKSCSLDVLLKRRQERRIKSTCSLNWGSQKAISAHVAWDADRDQSKQLGIEAELQVQRERSGLSHSLSSKVQILDLLEVHVSSSGQQGFKGPNELSVAVSGRKCDPISVTIQHEMSQQSLQSSIAIKHREATKLVAEIRGKCDRRSSGSDSELVVSLKSPDNTFEDSVLSLQHNKISSSSSTKSVCSASFEQSSGKNYETKIEYAHQKRKSASLKVSLKTPHRGIQEQELSVSHQVQSDNSIEDEISYRREHQQVTLSSVLKKSRNEASLACSITTPFSHARDIKLFAGFENHSQQKHIESHLELNGQRKYDLAAFYKSKSQQIEIHSSLKTAVTPEISISIQSQQRKPSFSHELSITKDSSRVLSCKVSHQKSGEEYKSQIEIQTSSQTLLDIKATKEAKSSSVTKYAVKAKGAFKPISISVQSNENEENSISHSLQICREASERQCYNVKGYYKKEKSSDKYDKYRKITLDIEQEVRGSVQHLCNVHYLLSLQGQSIKSKFVVDRQGKKVGYDVSIERSQQEQQPCRLEASLTLPSRTMKATLNLEHQRHNTQLDIQLSPDVEDASQTLSLQARQISESQDSQTSGHLKLSHQSLPKPFLVKYVVEKSRESRWPQSCRLEMDYSSNSQDKLVAEITLPSRRSRQGQQQLAVKIMSEGNDIDMAMTVAKQSGRNDQFVSQFQWKSQRGMKTSQLIAKISDRTQSGWPKNAEIEFSSPSTQLALQAQSSWSQLFPTDALIKLTSQGKLLGEVKYEKKGQCMEVELRNPKPFWRNQACLSRNERQQVQMVSFQAFHQQRKCVDLSFEKDPSKSQMANVGFQWDKRELRQALKSLQKSTPSIQGVDVQKIRQEVQQKAQTLGRSLQRQVWKPLASSCKEQARKLWQEIKECQQALMSLPQMPDMSSLKQWLESAQQRVAESYKEWIDIVLNYLEENAPEWVREIIEKIKEIIEKQLKQRCSRGSFCHKLKNAYERQGMKKVQQVLKATFQERVEQVQRSSNRRLSEFTKYWDNVLRYFREQFDKMSERIPFKLPQWRKYEIFKTLSDMYDNAKRYFEGKYREYYDRFVEYCDRLLSKAMQHDICKNLVENVEELKQQIQKYWQQLDTRNIYESVKHTALQKIPTSWMKQRFVVQEFDTNEGRLKFQMRYPMDESKIQLLKNAAITLKNKITSRQ